MSDPASARSTTIRTDDGAAGSWERLLFRPVGLWVVLLLLLLSLAAVVIFGSEALGFGALGPELAAAGAYMGFRRGRRDLAAIAPRERC